MNIYHQAITGNETRDTDSPRAALIDFYRAFNHRDFHRMQSNWMQSEHASMSNPLGGIKRGWSAIEEVYKKIFEGSATVYVEFFDYSMHVTDTMFVAAGRERGTLAIEDNNLDLSIRTTRIFTLIENRWKQLHHHGSMDSPELLSHYQRILTGQ